MTSMIRFLFLLVCSVIFFSNLHAQTISSSALNKQVCLGGTENISYTLTGVFVGGNQFTAQLSDTAGSFSGTTTNIGSVTSNVSGSISITIPALIPYSSRYRIRIQSTSPVITSNTINLNIENTTAGTWISKTALDTVGREYAVAFSIGKFGYFGMGQQPNSNTKFRDMWQYNPETDVWTQMENYPVTGTLSTVGFSIGSKGYVGVGAGSTIFYEYDPTLNTWRSRASFIGSARTNPVAFSAGGKGYVGTGRSSVTPNPYLNDFYQYNPINDTWTAIASFPGSSRSFASAFTINQSGYVGMGFTGTTRLKDFFVYQPSTNTWSAIASLPAAAQVRQQATAFSINNRGFAGQGLGSALLSDFYEYDPSLNTWTSISVFTNSARRNAASFTIGNKAYVMTGASGTSTPSQKRTDLWEYSLGSNQIFINSLPSNLCVGSSVNITYNTGCVAFNPGNQFTMELSDSSGNFSSPTTIGTVTSTTSGNINVSIPGITKSSAGYQVRIKSSSPEIYSSSYILGISQPLTITLTSAVGTNNQKVCTSSPITNISYSLSSASSTLISSGLPTGVSALLLGNNIIISGSTTQVGIFNYKLKVIGGCNSDSVLGTLQTFSGSIVTTQPQTSPRQFCQSSIADPLFIAATGKNLTYQWFSSLTASNAAGTLVTGATDSFFNPPTASIGQRYYYCLVSGCGASVKSNISGIQTIRVSGSWIGNSSTDWNNPLNWCGGLPSGSSDVIIPSGTSNNPLVSTSAASCNNLFVQSGATLTLSADQILSISGGISNSGTINAEQGTIELNGLSEQAISGSLFANKSLGGLKISNPNGVVLEGSNDTLRLKKELSFGTSNCVLTTNGNLTLVSDSAQTAWITDMTSDGTNSGIFSGNIISGNVTVERYIPKHAKAWQLLSVPAIGRTIKQNWQESASGGANPRPGYGTLIHSNLTATNLGFDGIARNATCMTYKSSNNSWVGIPNTTGLMNSTRGYYILVRGDRSVTEYDQQTTATTLRISGQVFQPETNPPSSFTVASGKLETVGNPYASALDMTKFQRSRLRDIYYIFDPNLTSGTGSTALGGYRTLSRSGSGYIATPAETSGNSYYRNTNTNVQIQSGQAFFIVSDNTGTGNLIIDESCKASGSALVTKSNYKPPMISINLHKQNKEKNLIDGVMIRMDGASKSELEYSSAPKFTLGMQEYISLIDNKQEWSVLQSLPPNPEQEFRIRLYQLGIGNHSLEIMCNDFSDDQLEPVLEDRLTNKQYPIPTNRIFDYPFLVDANNRGETADRFRILFLTKSNPIKSSQPKITTSYIEPSWKITTNPVAGNSWNYQWSNMGLGNYGFEIIHVSGQLVHRQELTILTESGYSQIKLKNSLAKGVYRTVLVSSSGKKISQTILVE
jgi:N-acetylneuraminic acid mutarotase